MKLLIINPGSTSTKLALYDGAKKLLQENLEHDAAALQQYHGIGDQVPMRLAVIRDFLDRSGVHPEELAAVIGRGGLVFGLKTGGYLVNEDLCHALVDDDLSQPHASNLGGLLAREIAAWKRKVSAAWDQVRIVDVQRVKIDKEAVCVGEKYQFAVTLDIANLRPEDIGVEMVVARQIVGGQSVNVTRTIQLERTKADGSRVTYSLDYTPDEAGTFDVALRIYPSNPLLPHRMDFALVKWA